MIAEHAAAVIALLTGAPKLYDGQIPDMPAYPYRVIYVDTGIEDFTKLCATSDMAHFRFQVTSVALTAQAVRLIADVSRGQLLDARLVVTGRRCTRIRHETSIPVRPDASVTLTDSNLHPMFAVDTYHFVSYAA